ncbi:MAG: CAP domain-containing protein [Actinomycetota bacterium]
MNIRRYPIVAIGLTVVLLLLTAPAATALTSVEACFFNKINAERSDIGRSKLALKGDLTALAREHSARMAEDGTIYHNKNLSNDVEGNWWAVGENVGMGPTCPSLHDAFMASPGHKANIIDKDYNQIGVGVVIKDETIYVTEVFAGRPSGGSSGGSSAPKPQSKPVTAKAAPAKPLPKPKPPTAEPRAVSMLLMLIGMDVRRVDPASGAAMGV